MPATKPCPSCSKPIEIDPTQIGAAITCSHCGRQLSVVQRNRNESTPPHSTETSGVPERWQEHVRLIAKSAKALGRMVVAKVKQSVNETFAQRGKMGETTTQNVQESNEIVAAPSDKEIALWNPMAVGRWSLLFTWAWGAFLVSRNWRALGDAERADRNMVWFYAIFAYLFMCYFLPNTLEVSQLSSKGTLVIYAIWCYIEVRKQIAIVKERFGDHYQRKTWAIPLGIGFFIFVLAILGVIAQLHDLQSHNSK